MEENTVISAAYIDREDIKELFGDVLDFISEGIVISDEQGRIVYSNKNYTYLSAGESYNQYNLEDNVVANAKRYNVDNASIPKVIKEKKECINVLRGISGRILISKGKPIFDQQGNLRYVLATIRDVSTALSVRDGIENVDKIEKLYADYMKHSYTVDGPIAISPNMIAIIDKCKAISPLNVTVLLLGESGVGKEVIANYIQSNSLRKNKPFIAINCGAIPENLIESELFGYVGGAFSGASKCGKKGAFEAANGGTLFLDEMAELPLAMQVKLLRILESKKVTRLGDTQPIDLDVRIIVATNKDLEECVEKGTFRRDLYYRINVISIIIPPLRERKPDVIALANHFLNLFNAEYIRNRRICIETYETLADYNWPGNVRELRNVIEQAVIISQNDEITPEIIGDILPEYYKKNEIVEVNGIADYDSVISNAEKQLLEKAMQKYTTTRELAKALNLSQTSIVRKLKKYGLKTRG